MKNKKYKIRVKMTFETIFIQPGKSQKKIIETLDNILNHVSIENLIKDFKDKPKFKYKIENISNDDSGT